MIKVAVLLSYYNGYKYIDEQISSILNQRFGEGVIDIYIRNDGSNCTASNSKLLEIKRKFPHITIIQGNNVGVVNSFFNLLKDVEGYDFYAFCDQDDFWLPNKIINAVSTIKIEVPSLYCGSYTLVDSALKPLSSKSIDINPSFQNALFKNFCTGCTCVINNKLRTEFIEIEVPNELPMHDWYLLLLAYCVGEVSYDQESNILYRQHGNNVVGGVISFRSKLKRFIKHLIYGDNVRYLLLVHLSQINKNISQSPFIKDLLLSKLSFSKRIMLLLKYQWTYKSFIDRLSVYIVILLYRF